MNMESGFGWHYPPGTPGPRTTPYSLTCGSCGKQVDAVLHEELGTSSLDPEECPACGEPWDDDVMSSAVEPEPDWDIEREEQRQEDAAEQAMDDYDDAHYHYPEGG